MGGDWHMPHLRKYLAEQGESSCLCAASAGERLRAASVLAAALLICWCCTTAWPALSLRPFYAHRCQLHLVYHGFCTVLPLAHHHPHWAVLPQHRGESAGLPAAVACSPCSCVACLVIFCCTLDDDPFQLIPVCAACFRRECAAHHPPPCVSAGSRPQVVGVGVLGYCTLSTECSIRCMLSSCGLPLSPAAGGGRGRAQCAGRLHSFQ